ncbi:MAG: hypothetical protein A2X94_07095 [Bdellovibrionales bacterium GWB1_55_8]|nr:MAG: hypothetical protein A2X94_07095 [Bdellovibrionales bacterium GWB1_55_8]
MIIREMRGLKPADHRGDADEAGPALAATLLIPARAVGSELLETVRQACRHLDQQFPDDYEVILIPNPGEGSSENDQSIEVAEDIRKKHPHVRVCPHRGTAGKGAALRTGFLASRGAWIFFTDADLPYDLSFLTRAAVDLRNGCDFVTGNRRLPDSQFEVPVTLLPLAYGRHRLGLWFNSLVRFLLPIKTTDTQAGIKAMTREFANQAFRRQICPGFFFDLEFFLTASAQGFRQKELTVELFLRSEKSTVRVMRQSVLAGYWLSRIVLRHHAGAYRGDKKREWIVERFTGADLGTRFFLWVRWKLTPYRTMASWLPRKGRILDLGCGHGLLSIWSALGSSQRGILAIDHDSSRIAQAKAAATGLLNLEFRVGGVSPMPEGPFTGISMIDVFHYFSPAQQAAMAKDAFDHLENEGVLLVREVEPSPQGFAAIIARWNRLYERLATWVGFTQANELELHFRSRAGWEELFRSAGFDVHSEPCSSSFFSDVLFVCRKAGGNP